MLYGILGGAIGAVLVWSVLVVVSVFLHRARVRARLEGAEAVTAALLKQLRMPDEKRPTPPEVN